MSLEEILDDINERLGSTLKAVPPTKPGELPASEIYYSGLRLYIVTKYWENSARRVLDNNANVDRLWHERTGISVEDATWVQDAQSWNSR